MVEGLAAKALHLLQDVSEGLLFFALFVHKPVEEADSGMLLFGLGDVHEVVDAGTDELLVIERLLEDIGQGVVFVGGLLKGHHGHAATHVGDKIKEAHGMELFFFGLYFKQMGEAIHLQIGAVGRHGQVEMGAV